MAGMDNNFIHLFLSPNTFSLLFRVTHKQVMYGLFDVYYHESWSLLAETQFMKTRKLQYSVKPLGKQKGCFQRIIRHSQNQFL